MTLSLSLGLGLTTLRQGGGVPAGPAGRYVRLTNKMLETLTRRNGSSYYVLARKVH